MTRFRFFCLLKNDGRRFCGTDRRPSGTKKRHRIITSEQHRRIGTAVRCRGTAGRHSRAADGEKVPGKPFAMHGHSVVFALSVRFYQKKEKPHNGCTVFLELVNGIEPSTCSLRMSCSAIEPHQHFFICPLIIQYLFAIIKR